MTKIKHNWPASSSQMSKSISEGDRAFQIIVHNLREGHCTLFFLHSHSHSHNDIGNVYLLFLSKAKGQTLHKALWLWLWLWLWQKNKIQIRSLNVHFVTSFTQIGVGAKLQSYLGVETNRASVPTEQLKVSKLNVLFVTSNHQFRFPPFIHNFFWVWAVEKEN